MRGMLQALRHMSGEPKGKPTRRIPSQAAAAGMACKVGDARIW